METLPPSLQRILLIGFDIRQSPHDPGLAGIELRSPHGEGHVRRDTTAASRHRAGVQKSRRVDAQAFVRIRNVEGLYRATCRSCTPPPFSFGGTSICYHRAMLPSPTRRFPPPWSIEERTESFIVKDANDQQLADLYFEDEPQRQMSMKRLSRDEAFLIAVTIAKLPSAPRQILKDIPRAAKFGQPGRLSAGKLTVHR